MLNDSLKVLDKPFLSLHRLNMWMILNVRTISARIALIKCDSSLEITSYNVNSNIS
jgi:hypothetical protein